MTNYNIFLFNLLETFMVVDCEGDTVNSTTIQLLEGERLNIMTERNRNDCGDNFIDQEFLKFLERKIGSSTIKLIKVNQYNQFQNMLKEFYRKVKMEFTGIQSEFHPIDLELDGNIYIYLTFSVSPSMAIYDFYRENIFF